MTFTPQLVATASVKPETLRNRARTLFSEAMTADLENERTLAAALRVRARKLLADAAAIEAKRQ